METFAIDRLTEYLVSSGHVSRADVEKTRHLAEESAQSVGLMLTRVGLVSDADVASAYAHVLKRPLLREEAIPLSPPSTLQLKQSFLREAYLLPIADTDTGIEVATADPENAFALEALSMAARKPVSLTIATLSQVDQALDRWFAGAEPSEAPHSDREAALDDAEAINRLRDLASQAPVVRFVNALLQRATESQASDIHIEPHNSQLRVRLRMDGMLKTVETASARSADAIISRVKLMARMNIAERRLPQDGRIHIKIQGADIDLRVSTVPTVDGESVVLRVLDQQRAKLELAALGFAPDLEARLGDLMQAPNGIVLVTGPTGSGKTTTLYSLLKQVNSEERKLITIEDPVEYQLEGVNQIQVKPQIGLDFAHALRSIVRQDPDVIMVGEMRDLDTARVAVQSALTGHLVLSTLHTNDAGSTVTRLLDMGIEDYLLTSSVNAILAQRLVRALCGQCQDSYAPPPALVEELKRAGTWHSGSRPTLYRAAGCGACDHTGYRGRTVISELLVLSEEIRRAVLAGTDGKSIQRLACETGMVPLQVDGLQKAVEGKTTIEEVMRVTLAS